MKVYLERSQMPNWDCMLFSLFTMCVCGAQTRLSPWWVLYFLMEWLNLSVRINRFERERENSLFLNIFCVCSVLQDHDCTINNKCSAVCISCRIPKYSIWPKDKVCKSFYNDLVGSLAGSKTKEVGIHSNWKTGKVSF